MTTFANSVTVKVLLVEDNPGDARLVQEMLRNTSPDLFEVTWVERLSDAVARLDDGTFDIILLDLSLPDAVGLDTLTRMNNAAHTLPIIVLTGRSDETLGVQALGEGAQDYLLKQNLDSFLLKRVLHYAIERKRVDQVQRESEERFRALVQNSTDVITILAADMTVLYESPSLEKVTGYKPEAVQGLRITDIIHPDDLPLIMERMTTLLGQPGATISVEVRLRHADGSWRTHEATMTNLLDNPAIHGIVVNSHDITERKRSEEVIQQSERLLRDVLETLPVAVWIYDVNGQITHGNPAGHEIWSGAKYVGLEQFGVYKGWWVDTGKPLEAHDWAAARAVTRGETSLNEEIEIECFDGTHKFILNSALPLLNHGGEIAGAISLNQDITDRKRAEQALQLYNRRIGVLHNIDRGILTAETPQRIAAMIAQSLLDMTHCDAVRIIAIKAPDGLLPYLADYPPASQMSQDMLRQAIDKYGLPESFRHGEALVIDDTKTYEGLWMGFEEVLTRGNVRSWIIVPIIFPLISGEPLIGIVALGSFQPFAFTVEHFEIAREVTDQLAIALHKNHLDEQIQEYAQMLEARVAERTRQLHSAKERLETILMSVSDAIMVANLDGSIQQVNTAFTALFGYTLEQGQAMSLYSLLDADSVAVVRRISAELAEGGQTQHVELVGLRQDGTLFDADAAFAPVVDGLPTILICSIRDITARKRAEAELRQAWVKEKELNALKTGFVSMVSHDFRSPLASIQSSSDLLRNYSERMTDEKKEHHFSTINGQIKHLTGLLEDMLTVTQADSVGLPFLPVLTDLGVFCQTIADEMQALAGTRQIRFSINRPDDWVRLDPNLLRRALVNLLSNAVKYSPEDGVADFSVQIGDESIEISVKDRGIGIPEADQVHLFEVFHRAQNVGPIAGTGLGLAIVKRVIDAHGGTIRVQSAVDVGTTFTISLPLLQAEAETR